MKNMTKILGFLAIAGLLLSPVMSSIAQTSLSVEIVSPESGQTLVVGNSTAFMAQASGGEAPYAYTWDFGDGDTGAGPTFDKTYDSPGSYLVKVTATDFNGLTVSTSRTVTVVSDGGDDDPEPVEVVIVSPANNADIVVGQSTAFMAQASGGEAPYAYTWDFGDGDTGAGPTFDKIYTTTGTKTVTVTASDFNGQTNSASITIDVVNDSVPIVPTVDLKVNGSNGPVSVANNSTVNIAWDTTDATACTASGSWSGSKAADNGSETTGALTTGTYVYTLTCSGPGGSANDSVTVNVEQAGGGDNDPTVDLRANGQGGSISVASTTAVTLTWDTTDATSCVASGSWSGSKAADNGSESVGILGVGSHTYTLNCTGPGGSASDSVVVTVTQDGPRAPVISNVRVTDITQTSAIVRWDTDIAADSRVIYDTVSHPDISGAAGPNYGYANSSATQDTDTKVTEHAVQLTGLSSNTQYYFRVLSAS